MDWASLVLAGIGVFAWGIQTAGRNRRGDYPSEVKIANSRVQGLVNEGIGLVIGFGLVAFGVACLIIGHN